MKHKLASVALVLVTLASSLLGQSSSSAPTQSPATAKRLQEWRDARFGMFIHWGLYAIPAGEWKGEPVPGIGEWIMNHARIPVSEYQQLASQFNPVDFNADEWVRVAKEGGAKYIVITSKHHDGFAIFGSQASKYNIVDATPFHRDPLKELAVACQKAGIMLGFYHSQTQDWYEPDGFGNDWDYPESPNKNFQRYLETKVKPQLRELLTNYGPIGLIWFDTPKIMTKEQSEDLAAFVHKLQPDCLVSGRIGNDVGDYDSTGDNQITVGLRKKPWEAPVTMNDTWGFKKNDNNWKPVPVLVRQLVRTVSGGGNLLLNVGPDAKGVIPAASVERLAEMGRWLKVNGDSIYGAEGNPFPYPQSWGLITSKPGRLYLHLFDWPKNELVIDGLNNEVTKAYLLANRNEVKVVRGKDRSLRLQLPPAPPDNIDSVVVLEIKGAANVERAVLQEPDGKLALPAYLGEIHNTGARAGLRFDGRGVVENWSQPTEWLSWGFRVSRPGKFKVQVVSSEQKYGKGWEGGHVVSLELAGQSLKATVNRDTLEVDPTSPYWNHVVSNVGQVEIGKAGTYTLNLKPEKIESAQKFGFTLVSIRLIPAQE